MCLAIPAQITAFEEGGGYATVAVAGVRRRINVELLREEPLAEGDWVLIHVGFAMSRISAGQADEQLRLLTAMGEAQAAEDEIRGYRFEDDPAAPPGGTSA